jgi:hypothetical protein
MKAQLFSKAFQIQILKVHGTVNLPYKAFDLKTSNQISCHKEPCGKPSKLQKSDRKQHKSSRLTPQTDYSNKCFPLSDLSNLTNLLNYFSSFAISSTSSCTLLLCLSLIENNFILPFGVEKAWHNGIISPPLFPSCLAKKQQP